MKKDTHPNYPEVNVACSCGISLKHNQLLVKTWLLKFALYVILFIQENKKFLIQRVELKNSRKNMECKLLTLILQKKAA